MGFVKNRRPAAFLDRDGVIVRDFGYTYRVEDLEILPGVFEGLRYLKSKSYFLILISNQSGVARGRFTKDDVDRFHNALQEKLVEQLGFGIDGFYYCPHHPSGSIEPFGIECDCRKPKIGLIERAASDFAIDWQRSIMVGDKDCDVECASRAGVRGIRLVTGQYSETLMANARIKSLGEISSVFDDLFSAL